MNPQPIASESPRDLRRWVALVVVCLGQLMIVLDTTIVNVALPSIQRDLHLEAASLTWVVSAYLVSFGSFLLLAGRIGDLIGRKKVFLSGVVLFVVTSALCGLAWNSALLIAARFLQGLGGALASAVIVALIVTGFPDPAELDSDKLAAAAAKGMVDSLGDPYTTLSSAEQSDLLTAQLRGSFEGIGVRQGVDVLGSILVTSAMMLAVYTIVQSADHGWWSASTAGLGGAAAVLLAAFLALEARLRNPIMPLRIFRLRSLAGSSAARAMLAPGMFSSFFFGTQYLQHILGYGAVGTGLAFLPQTFAVGLLSVGPTAALMRRIGARPTAEARAEQRIDDDVRGAVELLARLTSRLREHAERDPAVASVRPRTADGCDSTRLGVPANDRVGNCPSRPLHQCLDVVASFGGSHLLRRVERLEHQQGH